MGGTILARDGRRVGDNTDGAGCLMALEEELDCVPAGRTAAVLGAGGCVLSASLHDFR